MTLSLDACTRKDQRTGRAVDLQHRHFAFIASVIASVHEDLRPELAMRFADACASTNPNFDRARFMRACNVTKKG